MQGACAMLISCLVWTSLMHMSFAGLLGNQILAFEHRWYQTTSIQFGILNLCFRLGNRWIVCFSKYGIEMKLYKSNMLLQWLMLIVMAPLRNKFIGLEMTFSANALFRRMIW